MLRRVNKQEPVASVKPDYKEMFRKQVIDAGEGSNCVIDKDTYSRLPDVAGCFKSDNRWVVYETDKRSNIIYKDWFDSEKKAYSDLASRLGFEFKAEPSTADNIFPIVINGKIIEVKKKPTQTVSPETMNKRGAPIKKLYKEEIEKNFCDKINGKEKPEKLLRVAMRDFRRNMPKTIATSRNLGNVAQSDNDIKV